MCQELSLSGEYYCFTVLLSFIFLCCFFCAAIIDGPILYYHESVVRVLILCAHGLGHPAIETGVFKGLKSEQSRLLS